MIGDDVAPEPLVFSEDFDEFAGEAVGGANI